MTIPQMSSVRRFSNNSRAAVLPCMALTRRPDQAHFRADITPVRGDLTAEPRDEEHQHGVSASVQCSG
jgi:hypothetical protein